MYWDCSYPFQNDKSVAMYKGLTRQIKTLQSYYLCLKQHEYFIENYRPMDQGDIPITIVLDLSKALDTLIILFCWISLDTTVLKITSFVGSAAISQVDNSM